MAKAAPKKKLPPWLDKDKEKKPIKKKAPVKKGRY